MPIQDLDGGFFSRFWMVFFDTILHNPFKLIWWCLLLALFGLYLNRCCSAAVRDLLHIVDPGQFSQLLRWAGQELGEGEFQRKKTVYQNQVNQEDGGDASSSASTEPGW